MAPGDGCQHNGVKFLPLDAMLQLLRGPPPVKPLSLTVGTIADGAGAVCEQLEVGGGRGGGPLWQKEKGPAVPWCGKFLSPAKSSLKASGSDIVSWGVRVVVLVSIILRRNDRPAGTTLAAKLRVPMRDRSSCFLHHVRADQQ